MMKNRTEQLKQWWGGLSETERAEARRRHRLSPQMLQELKERGLLDKDHRGDEKDEDVVGLFKMRH